MPKQNEAAERSQASTATADGYGSGSVTPEEDYLEHPLEDISEAESSAEEYESDFEDDFCTEDEVYSEVDEPRVDVGVLSVLSTVREEQDWTRVMSNYVQDLHRADGGSSPPRRSSDRTVQGQPPGTEVAHPSSAGSGSGGGGVGIMDMKERAKRVREGLIEKMGDDTFHNFFDFLFQARNANTDERTVRRELEARVGRDIYKTYCFEVDQLVFQQMCYS